MRIIERESTTDGTADVAVLAVAGELAGESVAAFRTQAMQKLEARPKRDIVLELSELDGIDSQGLEAMLALQDEAAAHLAHVRLAACPETLTTVLRLTRLTDRFDIDRNVEDALASLRAIGANA